MKNIDRILLLIVATLVVISFFIGRNYDNQKLERAQSNYRELLKESNNKLIRVTSRELNKISLLNDSLLNKLIATKSIKKKNVTRIIKNNYYNNYDTTIVVKESINGIKKVVYKPDSCLTLKLHILKDSIKIDTLLINYKTESIYWWRRETKKRRRIFFPFGHKRYYVNTTNNCKGTTTTSTIDILKR